MITLHKWYPMVGVADYPTKTDVSERRASRIQEEYDIALKFKKAKYRVNELEVELYNKKCDQHKLSLEILQISKVDVVV